MTPGAAMRPGDRRAAAVFLIAVAALVAAMVALGGVTRLTGSGLSMTDWRPLTGWLPPMDAAEWEAAFAAYRDSPEYRKINRGMTAAEFRTIFWFEYSHRLLGRLVAIAFFVPFMAMLWRKRLDAALARRLWLLLALGALQGFVGWFMVRSGLVERPSVSQYRLAMHLALAFLIYGLLVWTAAALLRGAGSGRDRRAACRARRRAAALLALVSLTVVSGAFVAGLDAGLYYNTFPLMEGRWIPADYLAHAPVWLSPFENVAAVQFNHRALGAATALAAVALWAGMARAPLDRGTRLLAAALAAAAALQAGLGAAALLAYVPVWLGALHQAGALALFTLALLLVERLRPAPRLR